MTTKQFVVLMLVITVLCWAGWLTAIFFINPETSGVTGFILFYASLFFATAGTLSLIGYAMRWIFSRQYSKSEEVTVSFRQAMFWGAIVVGALFLQGNRLLTWFNAIMIVALVAIIEFMFISFKKEAAEGELKITEKIK